MGVSKKVSVGLVAETKRPNEFSSKREPTRPCRFCGGAHWDDKCPNKKETTSLQNKLKIMESVTFVVKLVTMCRIVLWSSLPKNQSLGNL